MRGVKLDQQTYQTPQISNEGVLLTRPAKASDVDTISAALEYERWWSGTGSGEVFKKTVVTTVTTYTHAYGTWANRASLTYYGIDINVIP